MTARYSTHRIYQEAKEIAETYTKRCIEVNIIDFSYMFSLYKNKFHLNIFQQLAWTFLFSKFLLCCIYYKWLTMKLNETLLLLLLLK